MPFTLKIQRVHDSAIIPTLGSSLSAGRDLYSVDNTIVPPHGKALISTGIIIEFPDCSIYGRIAPRSGLAWKKHIDIGAGVIDADYRGEIKVVVFNHSSEEFNMNVGDKIAQIILEKCLINYKIEEVNSVTDTNRGAGGFGSTGNR